MKRKLISIIILMIVLLASCKSTNMTGKYSTQPGWVTLLPTSATYYYSKASSSGESSANSIILAQEITTNQITLWVEKQAIDYLINSNLNLNETQASKIVYSLNFEINEKILEATILIDKYIPDSTSEDNQVWVLSCFPKQNLDSIFSLCEEKATNE